MSVTRTSSRDLNGVPIASLASPAGRVAVVTDGRRGAAAERLAEAGATLLIGDDAVPMTHSGVADDVARLIVYRTLDLSEFVTGPVIPVDGGLSAA